MPTGPQESTDGSSPPRSRWIAGPYAASWFLPAVASASGEPLLLGWQAFLFGAALPPGLLANAAFWTGLLLYRRGLWRPAAACGCLALTAGLSHAAWLGSAARLSSGFWLWLGSFGLLAAAAARLGRRRPDLPDLLWDGRAWREAACASALAMALALAPRLAPWPWYRTHAEAPALLVLLESREPSLSLWAAERLSRLGLESEAAVPRLLAALEGPAAPGRYRAASALGHYGPSAAAAVPALIRALDAGDGVLAGLSAQALGRVGPAAKPAVPALMDMLERSFAGDLQALDSVRRITQLKVPDFAAAGLGAVLTGISDANPVVRHFAEAELARRSLAPVAGARLLARALRSRNPSVRRQAVRSLGALGSEAAEAVKPLTERLAKEPLASDRGEVAKALGRAGPAAAPAAGELARVLDEDPDPLVRLYAAKALGDIGPRAAKAVPALLRARRGADASVRGWAADALMKVDPDTAASQRELPALAPPLRRPDGVR